ncbi:AAA family ATPase [Variovorax ureilyticus]|uniref:AAA family ATPase n=1 Tax=Variovorax ureilyticus TaxID=1836198 RepID=A0ABU8VKZ5_9BURK
MSGSRSSAGDEAPEGYSWHRVEPLPGTYRYIELLLPSEVKEARLVAEVLESERLAASSVRVRTEEPKAAPSPTSAAQTPSPQNAEKFIKIFEKGVARRNRARRHQVLEAREILRVLDRIGTVRNKDDRKREFELMDRVTALGALRGIANPAFRPARWERSVSHLRASHPHFRAVTDFVCEHVVLSASSKEPLYVPPIHIWGPPGIGKSHYANDLALALEAPLRRQSMENAQTTSLLLGTERHWSNAAPGAVFEQIVLGQYANPVFLIDEIDKAPIHASYDPLAPLHSLLEPLTASTVRDAGLDITFDARLVIYIAASNNPHKVPESLRSRFTEFEILRPRGEHALQIAQVVMRNTVERLSVPNFAVPEPRLAFKLAHLDPRAIRKAVQSAVARAVLNERRHLRISDFSAEELDEEGSPPVLH